MSNHKTIIVEENSGIVRVTLNQPDKLNALSMVMYQELSKVVDEMESNPGLKVLVVGIPVKFSKTLPR